MVRRAGRRIRPVGLDRMSKSVPNSNSGGYLDAGALKSHGCAPASQTGGQNLVYTFPGSKYSVLIRFTW